MKRNDSTYSTNIFIKFIYEKIPFNLSNIFKKLKHIREVKKFRRNILDGSPSFGILWQMAEFIKLAETIFFYDNSMSNSYSGLYSSRNFTDGQNGFRVFDNGYKITIKLFKESRSVALEIERTKGDKSKSFMSFTNDTWDTTPTIYDEMLLEQAIKFINCKIIKLFDECYDTR